MAWSQRYDGVNDYALFASPVVIPASTPFVIEWMVKYDVTKTLIFAGNTADTDTQLYAASSGGNIRLRDDAQDLRLYNTNGSLLAGVYNKIKLTRDLGNTVTLEVNDSPEGSSSGVAGAFTFDELNKMSGVTASTTCDYQYLKIDVNGSPVINLDATSSNHVAGTPILTDTVSSNDATGVNMPTDGSVWVDLGGSGISITATPIPSSESFGVASVKKSLIISPLSILSSESFGNTKVINPIEINVNSFDSSSEFGNASILIKKAINVIGFNSSSVFGKITLFGDAIPIVIKNKFRMLKPILKNVLRKIKGGNL